MYLYELFLIRPDLRHEETILAINCNFEYLTNVINSVFDRIDARIDDNSSKIRELNSRTAVVKSKIESLIGINKAITIFSPQKYPASAIAQDSAATFTRSTCKSIPLNTNYKVESKPEPISRQKISDKLQFYHVQQSSNQSAKKTASKVLFAHGLGPFPYYTESINHLLLFNEVKNMYAKSEGGADSTLRNRKKSSARNVETPSSSNRIDQSLLPVLNRNFNSKKINESLFYTPNITNAPELDVPQYLPDLPGIADDIEFNISNIDDLLIVPSQSPTPSAAVIDLPSLPAVSEASSEKRAEAPQTKTEQPTSKSQEIEQKPTVSTANIQSTPKPIPNVTAAVPPPPPPVVFFTFYLDFDILTLFFLF